MLDDVTVPLNLHARAALPERLADPESEPTAHRVRQTRDPRFSESASSHPNSGYSARARPSKGRRVSQRAAGKTSVGQIPLGPPLTLTDSTTGTPKRRQP